MTGHGNRRRGCLNGIDTGVASLQLVNEEGITAQIAATAARGYGGMLQRGLKVYRATSALVIDCQGKHETLPVGFPPG